MSAQASRAASSADVDAMTELFEWLRAAGAVEDHVPSRVLTACLAVEWGITTDQAQDLVRQRLACIGLHELPEMLSGGDATYVLATADPHVA